MHSENGDAPELKDEEEDESRERMNEWDPA